MKIQNTVELKCHGSGSHNLLSGPTNLRGTCNSFVKEGLEFKGCCEPNDATRFLSDPT